MLLFKIVNTVIGGFQGRIRLAYEARNNAQSNARKGEAMSFQPEYLEGIKNAPFLSSMYCYIKTLTCFI